jgi:hypothetical protein
MSLNPTPDPTQDYEPEAADGLVPPIRLFRVQARALALGLEITKQGDSECYRLLPTEHALVPITFAAPMTFDKLEQVLAGLLSEHFDGWQGSVPRG